MREAMFDRAAPGRDLLNADCTIYKEIGKIAALARSQQPLRFGRIYYRQISGDAVHFGLPFGATYTLAFSRMLYGQETLVAYNVSGAPRADYVVVDSTLHAEGTTMTFLYGGAGTVSVRTAPDGTRFVQLNVPAHGFAILA
jgi:hypothetical protein